MSKVFRIHTGDNTISDWQQSAPYSTNVIKQIKDPNGATPRNEITSIPSPFARIDLVKNAFKEVVLSGLDGNTIYHKMVSDSLDIGEIFFNYDRFKDNIRIVCWDKTNDLLDLKQSTVSSHKIVGETLEMYMDQDGTTYNFSNMQRIYMLQYIGPHSKVNDIIGATSPCTLFFSSANDLSRISPYISFDGNDKPFDSDYQPLYKRDIEYVKYLCALKASYPRFAIEFPEVTDYLTATLNELAKNPQKQQIINEIRGYNNDKLKDYKQLVVDNNNVSVINELPLFVRPNVKIQSDFEIASVIYSGDNKPLVLPIEKGNQYAGLRYTTTTWNANNSAPFLDDTQWENRTLPITGEKHPYLTISDFLEDNIIKMPYQINKDMYFDGGYDKSSESFLLPVKKLFFDFFTVDDLLGTLPNGEKMFELRNVASGSVNVTLRIPIKHGCIEYKRLYLNNDANISQNHGGIINKKFGLGIIPPVKTNDDYAYYRIAVFDKGETDIRLKVFDNKNEVTTIPVVHTQKNADTCGIVAYIIEKHSFDYLNISVGNNNGLLIPKLHKSNGNKQFSFAVDFGTTNTHIEFSEGGNPSEMFTITKNDMQFSKLHINYGDDIDIEAAYERYFIPYVIDGTTYGYPMRTAYAECDSVNYNMPVYTLANTHIPFKYEKELSSRYYSVITNLKWSNVERKRVELYIENIMFLLRNKVLLNNGNLQTTQIKWFYPTSMVQHQIDGLKKIWNELYAKYFGGSSNNIEGIPESIAPYRYYKTTQGAQSSVLTIDIGGETSDIFVVEDSKPKMMSSFRFASNAIFGDAFGYNSDNNGFVSKYLDSYKETLQLNNLNTLLGALRDIVTKKKSSDIIAFFYALSNNRDVKKNNITALDFQDKLSADDSLICVFVMFYVSLLYFIAKQMKCNNLRKPLTIAFSGNGANSLKVLSTDKNTLQKFAKKIFEDVYGEKYDNNEKLDVILEENPKKATCKGGILTHSDIDFDEMERLKFNLLGVDDNQTIDNVRYSDVSDNILDKVINQTEKLINYALSQDNMEFYIKYFGINQGKSTDIKKICNVKLKEYAKSALEARINELKTWNADVSCKLEETLYFYPIIGMLNNLAREMSK